MKFFTSIIFVAFICFHMHTFTKHRHEPSQYYTTNRHNFFTDMHHYNSLHLVPNSTIHVSFHLFVILNSSIRFRPRWSYPPFLFHTGNPCSLILLLLAGDVELNPDLFALTFTHLNIRSIRRFEKSSSLHNYLADHPTDILSLNETWLQPTDSDNFISSLAPSGFSTLNSPRLTGHGGGLVSFTDHSSKSIHSMLKIFLPLYLLNSWQLELLLATKKLSFIISIVLHLLKSFPFWWIPNHSWNFCSFTF